MAWRVRRRASSRAFFVELALNELGNRRKRSLGIVTGGGDRDRLTQVARLVYDQTDKIGG